MMCTPLLRHSRCVVFVDNVPALMALCNGSARSTSLDNMARVLHGLLFALKAEVYFEYVESDSNWTDEISRRGAKGTWSHSNGFRLGGAGLPSLILDLPFSCLLHVTSYL